MAISLKTRILLLIDKMDRLDLSKTSPAQSRAHMRRAFNRARLLLQYRRETLHHIKNQVIPAGNGTHINIRIYRPVREGTLPLILFFHGGGFVQGDLDGADDNCRRLAIQNRAVVVSVDYRLAPEHPYPAAPHDCYASLLWAVDHAEYLGIDPHQIVVMGDSAGGNLATVVSMMTRDRGGPAVAGQVLIYPVTDATMSQPSIEKMGKGYLLTKEMMSWFMDHYCGTNTDRKEAYLSPLLAPDLKKLPPALVITAGHDPLRDEGRAYAQRLEAAGNRVVYRDYPDTIHAFFSMPKYFREAREVEREIAAFMGSIEH